ncbi:hypothetical protein CLAIMM_11395 [Cladophialophora immunda]|nr:hypothetical protein CLAIMM_11395 [Cladophialophora immunda]
MYEHSLNPSYLVDSKITLAGIVLVVTHSTKSFKFGPQSLRILPRCQPGLCLVCPPSILTRSHYHLEANRRSIHDVMMLIHNTSLAEEVYALNAIYGEGRIAVTFSDAHHTTVAVRLPGLDYSFLLRVLDDYPRSCPQVLGVDNLVESTKPEVQQNAVYLGACVQAVHYPESVCLYDAIEEFETVHKALQAHVPPSEDTEKESQLQSARRAVILKDLATRARAKVDVRAQQSVIADSPFDVVDCVVCMDPFFRVDVVSLKCRHSFCLGCLHGESLARLTGQ